MTDRRLLLCLSIACLAACGDGEAASPDAAPAPDGGDASVPSAVTLSGVLIKHSMNRLADQRTGRSPAYTDLSLDAVSVDALATGATATALATAALDTAACPAMGGCAWSLPGANLAGVTLGLGARVRDNRASGQLWVTTVTGFASPTDVAAARQSGRFTDGRAFSVSRDAIDAVIAPMVGLTGAQVMERGLIFGLVYDVSTGAAADGSGTPIVGATVAANRGNLRIVYPNNTFSGTASATASQGAFLAVPDAAGPVTATTFTVTPPAGRNLTWDATRTMVVIPDAVYFAPMYAR
jgi:hypothetical protein